MVGADGVAGLCRGRWRWGRDCRGGGVLTVRLVGGDLDAVGGGVVGDVEVDRLPHVPEFHIVVAADGVCLQLDLLAVHIKGLAGRLRQKPGGVGCAAAEQGGSNGDPDYKLDVLSLHFRYLQSGFLRGIT